MDLSVFAPALTSLSGNPITPHGTSAEERVVVQALSQSLHPVVIISWALTYTSIKRI